MFAITSLLLAMTAMPSAMAATYDVTVGNNGKLQFDPLYLNAAPGDILNFQFHPKAHSVTQSSFENPCLPLEGGFNSGFIPVDGNATQFPTWQLPINSTKPTWIFCAQVTPDGKTHCGQGMVFAVNPTEDKSFALFQEAAQKTTGSPTLNSSVASSTDTAYTTPPAPSFSTVTVTVTAGSSTYTTTYESYAGSLSPTPAAQPQDHAILVGDNKSLTFSSNNINASVGDTVTFIFKGKNHTATRSTFLAPCTPLGAGTPAGEPFDSGFNFAFDAQGNPPASGTNFTINVNDTKPNWVFCRQAPPNAPSHCASGMVAAINAPGSGSNTFDAFLALAKRSNGTSSTNETANGSATGTGSGAKPTDKTSNAVVERSSALLFAGVGLFLGVAML